MCGLNHSTLVTLPVNLMGLLVSNSAGNECWALSGVALSRKTIQGRLTAGHLLLIRFFLPGAVPDHIVPVCQRRGCGWFLMPTTTSAPGLLVGQFRRAPGIGLPDRYSRRAFSSFARTS